MHILRSCWLLPWGFFKFGQLNKRRACENHSRKNKYAILQIHSLFGKFTCCQFFPRKLFLQYQNNIETRENTNMGEAHIIGQNVKSKFLNMCLGAKYIKLILLITKKKHNELLYIDLWILFFISSFCFAFYFSSSLFTLYVIGFIFCVIHLYGNQIVVCIFCIHIFLSDWQIDCWMLFFVMFVQK